MSQIWIPAEAGNLPPNVPTSFVTDSGTVIPASNVVNINGGQTSSNNITGIQVIANLTGSNNEVVQLTNRASGTALTSDGAGQTQQVCSVPMPLTAATYNFKVTVVAYNRTDNTGASDFYIGTFRTNGTINPTVLGNTFNIIQDDQTFQGSSVLIGTNNIAILTVTGQSGKTTSWTGILEYTVAS